MDDFMDVLADAIVHVTVGAVALAFLVVFAIAVYHAPIVLMAVGWVLVLSWALHRRYEAID